MPDQGKVAVNNAAPRRTDNLPPSSAARGALSGGRTPRPPLLLRLTAVFLGGCLIWGLILALNAMVLDEPTLAVRFLNAAIVSGLAIPMVFLARRHLDRRPWAGLRLQPPHQALRPLLIGIAAFGIPSAAGLGVALATGWVDLQAQVPWSHIAGWAGLLILLVFLYEALPEELIYRGYLQRNLSTVLKPWVAAIAQAVLFTVWGTALWVITEGWGVLLDRGLMFFGMAVVLGLLRVQTGSVWTAVGFHLAFQVVAQSILSDRMSTGNETGLMLAVIIVPFVFATTVADLLHRRAGNWSTPEPE